MTDLPKDPVRAREGDVSRPGDRRNPDYAEQEAPVSAPLGGLRLAGLILGPLVAFLILFVLPAPAEMSESAWRMTAFLSMWISNTATTIMMFAVALSVIDFIGDHGRLWPLLPAGADRVRL